MLITYLNKIYRNQSCPESIPDDVDIRDALQGIVVTVPQHKTSKKGPVELWLSQSDQYLIRAYIAVAKNYAAFHKKPYDIDSPIFINKNVKQFKDQKRVINYGLFCKIVGIPHFDSHDARRMFASYCGNHTSLILREAAALASAHR